MPIMADLTGLSRMPWRALPKGDFKIRYMAVMDRAVTTRVK